MDVMSCDQEREAPEYTNGLSSWIIHLPDSRVAPGTNPAGKSPARHTTLIEPRVGLPSMLGMGGRSPACRPVLEGGERTIRSMPAGDATYRPRQEASIASGRWESSFGPSWGDPPERADAVGAEPHNWARMGSRKRASGGQCKQSGRGMVAGQADSGPGVASPQPPAPSPNITEAQKEPSLQALARPPPSRTFPSW
jgi:hypothetical protein